MPGRNPSFVWTRDALIEHGKYIYGRWDRLFGYWSCSGPGAASKPFVPCWPLLDKSGRLCIAGGKSRVAGESDQWSDGDFGRYEWPEEEFGYYDPIEWETYLWDGFSVDAVAPEAGDLFKQYIELIPEDTRRIAGSFGCWQWIILAMIRETPDFEDFLWRELRSTGPGFAAACLALAGAEQLGRAGRNIFCRRLMYQNRPKLIAELSGKSYSNNAVNWLAKLEADSCTRVKCTDLLALTQDAVKARVISHTPRLDSQTLGWLARVPAWACSVRLLACLAECRESLRLSLRKQLLELCQLVEARCPERQRDVAMMLRRATGGERLRDSINAQMDRLMDSLPFPSPPFPQQGSLQPLFSVQMMRTEGRRMRNCLGNLVRKVLNGNYYFYRWEGREPATVGITKDQSGVWKFQEWAGIGDAPLTAETRAQIHAAVQAGLAQMSYR